MEEAGVYIDPTSFREFDTVEEAVAFVTERRKALRARYKRQIFFKLSGREKLFYELVDYFKRRILKSIEEVNPDSIDEDGYVFLGKLENGNSCFDMHGKCLKYFFPDRICPISNCAFCVFAAYKFREVKN